MTRPVESQPSLRQRTLVGTLWLMLWRCATRGLGLISTLILARLLTPADFGLVAMAAAFAAGVEALSELRLQEALIRERENQRELLDTAFTLQLLSCSVSAVLLVVTAPIASDWFSEPRLQPVMLVLALAAFVAGFENIGAVEFRRKLRAREQVILLLVPRLVQVAVGLSLALVLRNYWALPVAMVALRAARVAMTYAKHPYRPRLSLNRWRVLAGFSAWSWAASLIRMVWERVDVFILGPGLGSRALGLYLLGREVAMLPVSELVEPAATMVYPAIAEATHEGRPSVERVPDIVGLLLFATIPLAIAVSASANCIAVLLLGWQWEEAVPVIAILAVTAVPASFSMVCAAALEARGAVRREFVAHVAATSARCGLVYAATLSGSVVPVAIAAVAAAGVQAALLLLQLTREGPARFASGWPSFLRLGGAGGAVVFGMWAMGLGWEQELPRIPAALAMGAATGAGVVSAYMLTVLGVWLLAGRPAGVESQLLVLVGRGLERQRHSGVAALGGRVSRMAEGPPRG